MDIELARQTYEEWKELGDKWIGSKTMKEHDATRKLFFAKMRELKNLCVEYERENGSVWDYDYWIDDIERDAFKGQEECRKDLFDRLLALNGVESYIDKSGVKGICVKSLHKNYYFMIHARLTAKGWVAVAERNGYNWRDVEDYKLMGVLRNEKN